MAERYILRSGGIPTDEGFELVEEGHRDPIFRVYFQYLDGAYPLFATHPNSSAPARLFGIAKKREEASTRIYGYIREWAKHSLAKGEVDDQTGLAARIG